MPREDVKRLMKRAENAWKIRDMWKSVLMDAYELAMPDFNPYAQSDKNHPRTKNRQFDGTAQDAAIRLANRMLLELTPPDQVWFDLKPGPLLKMQLGEKEIEQVDAILDQHVKVLSMVFGGGSWVSAVWEHYLDMIVSGMGVMLGLENPHSDVEPLHWQAVSQAEVALEGGAFGGIKGIHRRRTIKAGLIEETWSDAELPDDLSKIIKKDPESDIKLMECTYAGGHGSNVPFYYDVLWNKDGAPARIVERGYTTNPWIISRWMKLPGSLYGPGPILIALSDIRTANKVMEMTLRNAALALAGMYLVRDDGVVNPDNITITNGGFIPVAATSGQNASIAPLPTGRSFDIGQIILEDLRMRIKKVLLDNALPPLNGKVRSATEYIERVRELTQDIGGAIGRLTNDLIVTSVQRAHDVLSNRFPLPPLKIDQFNLKVHVNSPLARSQQFQDVEKVMQWWQMAQAMGGQEMAMMSGKIEEIIPWIADQVGVPAELVRSDQEREGLQQQIGQLVAAQQSGPDAMLAQGSLQTVN